MQKLLEKRKKFDGLADEAKLLEKEINGMIKNFEKKHGLSCWISQKKENKIGIEISIDSGRL